MRFNLKKGQIITILDLFLIMFVMLFAKTYMSKYNKNTTSLTKDGIKYTLVINNQKIKTDELLNIRIKVENKKREKKVLEFKKSVPFNYVIEKDGKLIYKRDIMEGIIRKPKKIFLNKYGKTEFGAEWYGNSLDDKKIEPGIYRIIVYSTDFNVDLLLNFEIIQEEK